VLKRSLVILLGAALCGALSSAPVSARGGCRPTKLTNAGGAAVASVGPVVFGGFVGTRTASLVLPPRGVATGFDARLKRMPRFPITVTGRRCRDRTPLRMKAFRGTQALTLPATIHGRGTGMILLRSPYRYYGIYPFFTKAGEWKLTLRSGTRLVGRLVVSVGVRGG
jgi:hypothetical protein